MSGHLTRILSDLHYGDRASRITRLAQLRPLLAGTTQLVFNGDATDTRHGPNPGFTTQIRAEVLSFGRDFGTPTTLLTGNHDPDISDRHTLELAAGQVFVTHGDILFDDIVPWGRDAANISRLITAGLAALPFDQRQVLEHRLDLWRRVCAQIPQRHQAERNRLKYALRFAADTVWPPLRFFHILAAWRNAPRLASALARTHRPRARFILTGHTHRPGVWRTASGVVVINTGSFCPPIGGFAADVTADRLVIHRVESRMGEFHLGSTVAEFSLADAPGLPTLPA